MIERGIEAGQITYMLGIAHFTSSSTGGMGSTIVIDDLGKMLRDRISDPYVNRFGCMKHGSISSLHQQTNTKLFFLLFRFFWSACRNPWSPVHHQATDVVENIPHLTDEWSGTVRLSGRSLATAVQLENLNFFDETLNFFAFDFSPFYAFSPLFLLVWVEKGFV